MRFLLDQDVYAATGRFLRELGHDVIAASEAGHSQASDEALLSAAQREQRVLVTRDRDFGALVFVGRIRAGVIYLRLSPATARAVHAELQRVLGAYSEPQLRDAFVVVEPGRHRFRQLGAPPSA